MPEASILVVDDEQEVCELLADWLSQDAEWSVDYTTEPRRALEQLGQGGYDLLITDLRMPEMDGLALARQARGVCPRLGVIAITGFASLSSSVEALRLGLADYLQKPFRVEDVRSAVYRALCDHARRSRDESAADELTHANAVLSTTNNDLAKRLELVSRDLTVMQQRLAGRVADLETRCDVADLLEGQGDVEQLMALSLTLLRKHLPGDEYVMALLERRPARATAVATIEADDVVVRCAQQPLSRGVLPAVLKRRQPALIENMAESAFLGNIADWMTRQGSLIVLPLAGNTRIRAVAMIRRNDPGAAFGTGEVRRALPLCTELGRALDVALTLQAQQVRTYRCLTAIADGIEAGGPLSGHSRRVADHACAVGRRLGLAEPRIDLLRMAARLHDIGKLFLASRSVAPHDAAAVDPHAHPDSHAECGWLLLRPLRFLNQAARLIRAHHDLAPSAGVSPIEQHILVAAETYDELTRDGPHAPGMSHADALVWLRTRAGISPDVLRALEREAPIDV